MTSVEEQDIRNFFYDYARRFNDSLADKPVMDTAGVRESFADYFVESSPAGVQGGRNGFLFRLAIPRGFKHYRKIGTHEMNIAGIDLNAIDDLHWMAKVHWDSSYEKKDGSSERIPFDVTYFLTTQSGAPKIFAYVAGDENRVLKELGIVD